MGLSSCTTATIVAAASPLPLKMHAWDDKIVCCSVSLSKVSVPHLGWQVDHPNMVDLGGDNPQLIPTGKPRWHLQATQKRTYKNVITKTMKSKWAIETKVYKSSPGLRF
jgi:hypothetical protein